MNNTCFNPACNQPAKVKFCSRSCSASYNNSILPRRKPTHKCSVCQKPTPASRRICSAQCRENKYLNTTIGELKQKSVRDAQVYNSLRQRSRRLAKSTNPSLSCVDCGWGIHTEVCHIIALNELPDTTPVWYATQRANFVLLCPNHHWQFDHDEEYRMNLISTSNNLLAH